MKSNRTIIKNEHFGIARKIVSNMTSESWETIPHASLSYEPEITKFLDVVKEINVNDGYVLIVPMKGIFDDED